MRGKKLVVFLTLLIFTSAAFNLPSLYAPPTMATVLEPQAGFVPPSNQTGNGYQMDLTESVNGWQSHSLSSRNTFVAYRYRNASFSEATPASYSLIWQNITVSSLQASNDTREIQGGSPALSTDFIGCGQPAAFRYLDLATNFTSPDTINLTVISIYYSTVGSPANIPLYIMTDSGSGTPSSTALGSGTLSGTVGEDWHNVTVSMPGGSPITLTRGTNYWIVMNGSSLPSGKYYKWFYVADSGSGYDNKHSCYYSGGWLQENGIGIPFNFLTLVQVLPVGDVLKARTYSSPAQVNMYLNATTPINNNVTRVSKDYRSFVLSTNTSVTFTATWTARFEYPQPTAVLTQYIAKNGFTLWNTSFPVGSKPINPYTWYNLTFRVSPIPSYWNVPNPLSNITNTQSYLFSFAAFSNFYVINQTNNVNNTDWNNDWTIRANSTYKIAASLAPQVIAGLPLTLGISTGVYSGSWCNVTFYNATDYPSYSRNITIPSNSYVLTIKLNSSGVHTLFLFDRWSGGNEASLNSTLTVTVLPPLCNVSVISTNEPLPGSTASIRFQFHNNSKGGEHMSPVSVRINGTSNSFTYSGEVVTANWSTATGGWHVGLNHVNVSATSGVYSNFTVAPITLLEPLCNVTVLSRNSPVLGNIAQLGFRFYNTTLGSGTVIQPERVSVNGTLTPFIYDGPSGVTSVNLSTASGGWRAGNNTLVISAEHGIFNSSSETWVEVLRPLCNVSVISVSQPILTHNASVTFRFLNNTAGGAPIHPGSVRINGTSVPFTYYSNGNVTVTWSTATGGWHTGLNHVNVSATKGFFSNFTVVTITIIPPLCEVSDISASQPLPGSNASVSFRFLNDTAGGTPMMPDYVWINGTSTFFTYSGGVVTTNWSIVAGGWHLGLNYFNVSAESGIFRNFVVAPITLVSPLCTVSDASASQPILGNNASVSFRFVNNAAGGTPMIPQFVWVNGTLLQVSIVSDVVSVTWDTLAGGWHAGLNYVNVSAMSGIFSNSTITWINIIQPRALLFMNATSYTATYFDVTPIGFKFLNTTSGDDNPLPMAPPDFLYLNGSQVSYTLQGDWYVFDLSTSTRFSSAGTYTLNFTACYRDLYFGVNVTSIYVALKHVYMSIHVDQTSVTIGSSLSVSANLTYEGGIPVEDGLVIVFHFTVTYQNFSVMSFDRSSSTLNGVATSSITTTGDMSEIDVETMFDSDGKRDSASALKEGITVTSSTTGGFPVAVVAGVAGIAVFAVLLPIVARARRKKGREEEHRKTAVLRQTASLAQLVVVDLKSGRCVFSRSLGSEEGVDPHLISGFLSANQSILDEVFKKKSKAGLRFADYGDYKVISHVGDYIMVTLFATEAAGEELKSVIEKFTDKFEKKYGKALGSWDGEVDAFKDADEITDEVFALQLTSPYMLLEVPSAKLSRSERAAVHFGRILSAERGVFFMPRLVDFLLTKQGLTRGKAMDAINSLTQKGVFRQLTIEQAAQVVKSTSEKSGNQA